LTVASLPKQVLEDVSEAPPGSAKIEVTHVEMAKVRAVKAASSTCPGLEGAMAELIVLLPELGIAEDMIGFRDLFEAALSLLISWVQVGMVFASQSTIGFLDVLFRGRALDPKYLIVIALCR
jgi:hypothetical protein